MRTQFFANETYCGGMPPESGMEALHVSPELWDMVQAGRVPGAAVWPLDAGRGPVDTHFRPAAPSAFGPYPRRKVGEGPARRVYLVAIERDVLPPISFGDTVLQRMRVMLAPPRFAPERAPEPTAVVASRSAATPSRPVRGEILRDDRGRLYEKIGSFVRELGPIEASPEGDLLEVQRSAQAREEPTAEAPKAEPPRKLFPDPGQWRVLRWGEFKGVLGRKVAHPERLRDDHRIPCYVQVLEVRSRLTAGDLAQALFGDPASARDLMMLTPVAAQRLDVAAMLPPIFGEKPEEPRERGVLVAGDRVFVLRPAIDPTADSPRPAERTQKIPDQFANQAFQRSREEVLAIMQAEPGVTTRIVNRVKALCSRSAFDQWQRGMWSKNPAEQLWASCPPRVLLNDVRVREWATATLTQAGYDVDVMLREWEIYWRRKGL